MMSTLDRFLLSAEWDLAFAFSKGLAKPRPTLDHIPLVLCGKQVAGAPKPFKFEKCGFRFLTSRTLLRNGGTLLWLLGSRARG